MSILRDPDTLDKASLVNLARMSEQCERYEDMIEFVKAITRKGEGLNDEEVNLLSLPYMCMINQRKVSLRMIDRFLEKSESSNYIEALIGYKHKIAEEIKFWCEDQIHLIDFILEFYNNEDPKCIKFKSLKARRYQDLIEVGNNDRKEWLITKAEANWIESFNLTNNLCDANTEKSGIALNLASFYYEFKGDKAAAVGLLNQTIIKAEEEISKPSGHIYSDTASTLKYLKEVYSSWTSELKE